MTVTVIYNKPENPLAPLFFSAKVKLNDLSIEKANETLCAVECISTSLISSETRTPKKIFSANVFSRFFHFFSHSIDDGITTARLLSFSILMHQSDALVTTSNPPLPCIEIQRIDFLHE